MAMRCVVYTCITGGYDILKKVPTSCKCIALTDSPPKAEAGAGQQWKRVAMALQERDVRMASRLPKFLPHQFFRTDVSIWTDGHIRWKRDPKELLEFLGDNDVAMFAHPIRNCLYQEAGEVARIWPAIAKDVRRQMSHYRKEGYPEYAGLKACGVIVRRHTKATEALGNAWWAEWARWRTSRDQLSFAYACWKQGVKCSVIPGNVFKNKFEDVERHLVKRRV
jgi:hypothetical protein